MADLGRKLLFLWLGTLAATAIWLRVSWHYHVTKYEREHTDD